MTETLAATGDVVCAHTKFAIIGAGPSRRDAPWDDAAWCVQALNEIRQPRYDRHWELHPRRVQSARDMAWLAQCEAPCYVLDPSEWAPHEIKHPVGYPLDWVLEQTGGARYFTNTFSLQIAFALAEGFREIGLWGLELDRGTPRERLLEKPCVEYWLGLAQGRGVQITLGTAGLCERPFVYGLDYEQEKAYGERLCQEFRRALSEEELYATPRDTP